MSNAEAAAQATFETRYKAAVAEAIELRADKENAERVIKELTADRESLFRERDELYARIGEISKERDGARASCAALRAGLDTALGCLPDCDVAGCNCTDAKAVASARALLAAPNAGEGWVSPERFAQFRADMAQPCDGQNCDKGAENVRLLERQHDRLMRVAERVRDEYVRFRAAPRLLGEIVAEVEGES